ncbi:MAG: DUF402 domain-containing protein [Gaiellaceae bacterium]
MRVGNPVLLRSIYGGHVRWTFPHRYAGEWDGRHALYCGPGSQGKVIKRGMPGGSGGYLEHWVTDAPPFDRVWQGTHVLRFMRPGDSHTVEIFWTEDWTLLGWYVNLQAPLVVHGSFFDTTDWALDVTVEPDGTWVWKDEDDFVEALALGVFDEEGAAEIRAEGERVIAERPWPTGWESWRPPSEWGPLPLPEDWHVV